MQTNDIYIHKIYSFFCGGKFFSREAEILKNLALDFLPWGTTKNPSQGTRCLWEGFGGENELPRVEMD